LKHTWETHEDYEGLNLAVKKINECAKYVNRAKAFHVVKHKLTALHEEVSKQTPGSFPLLKPGGEEELEKCYIRESEVTYQQLSAPMDALEGDIDKLLFVEKPNIPNLTSAYAFLFDQVILITKRETFNARSLSSLMKPGLRKTTVKFSHVCVISLEGSVLENELENTSEEHKNCIIIRTSDDIIHKIIFENFEKKKAWKEEVYNILGFKFLKKGQRHCSSPMLSTDRKWVSKH
jgi:hypothetical protein